MTRSGASIHIRYLKILLTKLYLREPASIGILSLRDYFINPIFFWGGDSALGGILFHGTIFCTTNLGKLDLGQDALFSGLFFVAEPLEPLVNRMLISSSIRAFL